MKNILRLKTKTLKIIIKKTIPRSKLNKKVKYVYKNIERERKELESAKKKKKEN